MKKIVRLTESDLVKLVKRVISEQIMSDKQLRDAYKKNKIYLDKVALVNGMKPVEEHGDGEFYGYALGSLTLPLDNYTNGDIKFDVYTNDCEEVGINLNFNKPYRVTGQPSFTVPVGKYLESFLKSKGFTKSDSYRDSFFTYKFKVNDNKIFDFIKLIKGIKGLKQFSPNR